MRTEFVKIVVIAFCFIAATSFARADLLLDQITITSDSSSSGDPVSFNVIVQYPGIEVPYTGPSVTLISNLSVDVNASSIDVLIGSSMFVGNTPFQGLRFSGLDSPGEFISGFTVQSSIGGISGVFDPAAIDFGNDFLNVDMQNVTNSQFYSAGDTVSIALQFSAVPEPGSFALLATAFLPMVVKRRRTKR